MMKCHEKQAAANLSESCDKNTPNKIELGLHKQP